MTGMEPLMEQGAAERVETLIGITESLNLIFEQENTAIEEGRPEEAAPLQAEKARLASAYAQSIRAVAADRKGVSAVDPALLSRLRAVTRTFEARAARQGALLDGSFMGEESAFGPGPDAVEDASHSGDEAAFRQARASGTA